MYYADLHLHSRYSRATSADSDLEHLAGWARRKGVDVVGTGDFTHPAWRQELGEKLVEAEPGLFRLRPDLADAVDAALPAILRGPTRFVLSVEISTIYKKGDKTRKVHHVLFAPDLDAVDRVRAALGRIGNLAADGRPILGLDSRDLLEIALHSGCHLIPAHIWTPWFAALGSRSGFDAIDDCYGDLAGHIFAVETGLSSDPAMNWCISKMDRFRMFSSSDAHSPAKLAREATVFDGALSYAGLFGALQTGAGYVGTIEFFPAEGKYHLDGHRACGVRWTPEQTLAHGGRCTVCGEPVTVGVLSRIRALADRAAPQPPPNAGVVRHLVPLPELLAALHQVGVATRTVQHHYTTLLERFGSELHILQDAPIEAVAAQSAPLAAALARLRAGAIQWEPGYDGLYGRIKLGDD